MILITGIFVIVGMGIYTVFHTLRKAINAGMVSPIQYPLLWAIIIIGFIVLFIRCSCF